MGPYASWETIGKTSAAIPTLRAIRTHVEHNINNYARYRSHSSPKAEEDIENYTKLLRTNAAHTYRPGRKVEEQGKTDDYVSNGSKTASSTIHKWDEVRRRDRYDIEEWDKD